LEELSSEEPREWGYRGVQQRSENWNWEFRSCTTEFNRERNVRNQLSVGCSPGKLVVEEKLADDEDLVCD
jgi:hypothetical protein